MKRFAAGFRQTVSVRMDKVVVGDNKNNDDDDDGNVT